MSERSDWIKHVHEPEVASLRETIRALSEQRLKPGDIRTINGKSMRFLDYEDKGLAWEPLDVAPPEGFVVVPREPTEAMLKAAYDAACAYLFSGQGNQHCSTDEERSADHMAPVYRAMISAAERGGE